MPEKFIQKLTEQLQVDLPGIAGQLKMSPSSRSAFVIEKKDKTLRHAGVLILLYPKYNELFIVFTLRHSYKGDHGGQVSLPGGKQEPFDTSITDTAIREAQEETGFCKENIQILGRLTPLHIPISNMMVQPIIGYSDKTPVFKIDPLEVKELIEIPLREIFNPINRKSEKLIINGFEIEAPFFYANGHHIWGATAMIISEFYEIIKKLS